MDSLLNMDILAMSFETFDKLKAQLNIEINNIVIPIDVTPSLALDILSSIDKKYGELRLPMSELDSSKDRYTKLISRIEKLNSYGNNSTERQSNAVIGASNYVRAENIAIDNPPTVNLYNIYDNIYYKYVVMKGFVELLDSKQKKMITILGVMKLDKELTVF